MNTENRSGLIAATFTPMKDNGELNISAIPSIVNQLVAEGVAGLYVCGGTGEGISLTNNERMIVAEAYIKAANGKVPVFIHVGQDSVFAARELAKHALANGADGISAMTPTYFKPNSTRALIDSLKVITEAAPDLPFIYYHFPAKSMLQLNLDEFVEMAGDQLPSMYAIKFTDSKVYDLQSILHVSNGKLKVFFGTDEMLLTGLLAGASGAIGSTYNFALPLYLKLIEAWKDNDLVKAQYLQNLSVTMVKTFAPFGGIEGQKAIMSMVGMECGPTRLPLNILSISEIEQLRQQLEEIGFFRWARS